MRLRRSKTAQTPVAVTVTAFSTYLTGLCIILSIWAQAFGPRLVFRALGSRLWAPGFQLQALGLRSTANVPVIPGTNLGRRAGYARLHFVFNILGGEGRA